MPGGDFVSLGPDAKVLINTVPFAVISGTYREVADEVDNTDTENFGVKRVKTGLRQMEIELEAQLSEDLNPHWSVHNLRPDSGNWVDLQLKPHGDGAPDWYLIRRFRLSRWEASFRVSGSEAQRISFSGKSDGPYHRPGDV
jgi:hypothetical protein